MRIHSNYSTWFEYNAFRRLVDRFVETDGGVDCLTETGGATSTISEELVNKGQEICCREGCAGWGFYSLWNVAVRKSPASSLEVIDTRS